MIRDFVARNPTKGESTLTSVMIFGSSGNTGNYLTSHLSRIGWNVHGVARTEPTLDVKNFKFHKGDIRDLSFVLSLPKDIDVVINLAALQPSILPANFSSSLFLTAHAYVDTNLKGLLNILEFTKISRVQTYFFTSTHRELESHWSRQGKIPHQAMPHINLHGDHSLFAVSKLAGAQLSTVFGIECGFRVFNLRLPMMFMIPRSPYYLREGTEVLMPFLSIIKDAYLGRPLEVWGNPNLKRDYVHVRNLLNLVVSLSESTIGSETYNVGTGEGITTEAFVRGIGAKFGADRIKDREIIFRPEINTYKSAVYDMSETKKIPGFNPVLFDEMLELLRLDFEEMECAVKWGWGSGATKNQFRG